MESLKDAETMNWKERVTLLSLFIVLPFGLPASNSQSGNILYLMQSGDPSKAIESYKQDYKATGHHDFELLTQIATQLLDQGYRSRDPEIQVLTIYGAGISANEKLLYILEDGLNNPNPQIQLISLNFLATYQNDRADEAVNRAMSSNSLPIRLEAAYYLAKKKYPTAFGQTETLMHKLDKELWFVFPQIFAMIGDPASIRILRKLMNNSNENVRIEAILSAAKNGRDDLLPQIRNLATHHNAGQQEACAIALGMMKDEASVPELEKMVSSSSGNVKLAALIALHNLGKKSVKKRILAAAAAEDLFAITALGDIEGTEEILYPLTKNNNLQVRINSSIALLDRKDPRSLKGIYEILIRDSRDLAFAKVATQGKGLFAWKAIPSAQHNYKDNPLIDELSITMREETLTKALELPEKDFLKLANSIFEKEQNDLIPSMVRLLENLRTPAAIELLKKQQQKLGAPLIRNYCNLALYRIKEEGPYAHNLQQWVARQHHVEMIQFRPLVPWELRSGETKYQLTAKETSQLLIESIEALASSQDNLGIEALLDAIQNGNSKNRYALAGLLMRAIQ